MTNWKEKPADITGETEWKRYITLKKKQSVSAHDYLKTTYTWWKLEVVKTETSWYRQQRYWNWYKKKTIDKKR